MSDDDKPTQVVRAIRARRAGLVAAGKIDGGAIAVGLVIPMVAFAPTIGDLVPPWLALGLVGVALFLGGFLTAFATSEEAACPPCHGALMGVAFVVLVAAVVASTVLAGDAVHDVAIVSLLDGNPAIAAGLGVAAVVLGTVGGLVQQHGPRPPAAGRNR